MILREDSGFSIVRSPVEFRTATASEFPRIRRALPIREPPGFSKLNARPSQTLFTLAEASYPGCPDAYKSGLLGAAFKTSGPGLLRGGLRH